MAGGEDADCVEFQPACWVARETRDVATAEAVGKPTEIKAWEAGMKRRKGGRWRRGSIADGRWH